MNRRGFLAFVAALAVAPKMKAEAVRRLPGHWTFRAPLEHCEYLRYGRFSSLAPMTITLVTNDSSINLLPGDYVRVDRGGDDNGLRIVRSVTISSDGRQQLVLA